MVECVGQEILECRVSRQARRACIRGEDDDGVEQPRRAAIDLVLRGDGRTVAQRDAAEKKSLCYPRLAGMLADLAPS
jgi:hypothetical protein